MSAAINPVPSFEAGNAVLARLLRESKQKFLASFSGVSDDQSRIRPAEASWSVLETIEHLTLAEKTMLGLLIGQRRPRSADLPNREELFLRAASDRSHKLEAPEGARPTGRFASLDEAAAQFRSAREAAIQFVERNTEDLRATEVTHPHPSAGTVSTYEMVILIAKHAERHALQIEETKSRLGICSGAASGKA
jgi:uncharacterized damage-inducible protein DinB